MNKRTKLLMLTGALVMAVGALVANEVRAFENLAFDFSVPKDAAYVCTITDVKVVTAGKVIMDEPASAGMMGAVSSDHVYHCPATGGCVVYDLLTVTDKGAALYTDNDGATVITNMMALEMGAMYSIEQRSIETTLSFFGQCNAITRTELDAAFAAQGVGTR